MKYSEKGWNKRKEERAGYAEFFQKHVKIIKNTKACCAECGEKLKGHVSEVAHILPKSSFKSIATNDENVIYLCGQFSSSQCHTNFDTLSIKKIKKMNIYSKVKYIFSILEDKITEKIPYKIYDKYTDD